MATQSSLTAPGIRCEYLGEPPLRFANNGEHIDPKLGISRMGPKSYGPPGNHPQSVRVGIVGSAQTIEDSRRWIEGASLGVPGDANHLEFPGCMIDRGFHSRLLFSEDWDGLLTASEVTDVMAVRPARARFAAVVELIESRLALLDRKDMRPEYVVLALPDDLYRKCRVVDYTDSQVGMVHRDLRRAIKAVAMKYRMPTQILRQATMLDDAATRLDGRRTKDHPSEIAWDFFTGLYFKSGGLPWGPVGLEPGTCHVGISFYRPLGSGQDRLQTSLVQAFDEHGDGLVLRGHEFLWDAEKEGTRSPHLSPEQARELVLLVLRRYREEMHQSPTRVVVHKTSQFWPGEREGFARALGGLVSRYDLVAMNPQSRVRLFPLNCYPPLRGTRFAVGDTDYLYTTGYIAQLKQFHGVHVPSALEISDHVGHDTPRETLLREILILSKMNWNSSRLGGLLPITLTFARMVGDIMREIPRDREPHSNYKFYM